MNMILQQATADSILIWERLIPASYVDTERQETLGPKEEDLKCIELLE